ncbi:pre-mRNA splicing factor CLF1 [Metarhizium album ARSEF 1941]|uniref:Pre-mRNA splicing factor CLF1 n=1 Tax=Metarhizium album (strain ARSEF 1941) TaxID=1081103 RepID=A0A0B2X100_METAS|nr:pre-mRNA splicing factor CLF1 [Metarhizium album ARSEF 1941]KHN99998.1 pre-mRNA splicing factor CLF1 [Metarhizium album ARSEF 1941]
MPAPVPSEYFDSSCTVIYNNTLYSYSPQAFMSRRLVPGANWTTLAYGEKVTGATCVGSAEPKNTKPAFFVVGGKASSDGYSGLQMFIYATGKWTMISLKNMVTKHRQGHSSTYIEATDTILIYGGSQDGKTGPSADTFMIQASEPYTVTIPPPAVVPSNRPPASVHPILTPITNADVIMVGGGPTPDHKKVFWFSEGGNWRYTDGSLAEPIQKDTSSIQGIVVTGEDTSKNLTLFDLSQSPNKVFRVAIMDGSGKSIANSPAINSESKLSSSLAPKETRENFAMAQGPNGLVVFSGGRPDSSIALFDTKKNSWINATAFFDDTQKVLSSHSTSTSKSTSVSSSSTAAATTTAATLSSAPDTPQDSGPSSNAILGITLGSIAGFLALLGLIIFLLRRRRKQLGQTEAGRSSHTPSEEKDMFAFNKSPFSPSGPLRGHRPQASAESYSSAAILMGRMNKEKSGLSRKLSNDTARSSMSSVHKQLKSKISKPIPQIMAHPSLQIPDERGVAFAPSVAEPRPRNGLTEAHDGTRRSSGWNRYWSGGSALQILGFGNGKRNTIVSQHSSQYSDVIKNPRVTQDSATVPPLHFEGRPSVNSVNSGSPVVAEYTSKMPISEGMSGTIERPVSPVSSGYSSGIPESINETWGPEEASQPWGTNRAPSSAYAPSSYVTSQAPGNPPVVQPPSGTINPGFEYEIVPPRIETF